MLQARVRFLVDPNPLRFDPSSCNLSLLTLADEPRPKQTIIVTRAMDVYSHNTNEEQCAGVPSEAVVTGVSNGSSAWGVAMKLVCKQFTVTSI